MSVRVPLLPLFCLALAPTLLLLVRTPVAKMPQVASGTDVLSVAFGDAKSVLSMALVHKADSYFHGGVDMDCPHCHGGDGHEGEEDGDSAWSVDPWRWLNARVRAPRVERHLQGDKAVEMMPWFWASVKSNPHNVEAWTAAWYAAAHVMHDRALARRVLDEAKRTNPDSPEIALTEGQHLYDGGRGDPIAAGAAFLRARELALAHADGDESKLGEDDARVYSYAGNYLRKINEKGLLRP